MKNKKEAKNIINPEHKENEAFVLNAKKNNQVHKESLGPNTKR